MDFDQLRQELDAQPGDLIYVVVDNSPHLSAADFAEIKRKAMAEGGMPVVTGPFDSTAETDATFVIAPDGLLIKNRRGATGQKIRAATPA